MRHHSVSSPFITIAIVNHSGINMSHVLVMKFAMLPGLVVQNYAFTRQAMIALMTEALRIMVMGVRQKVGEV